MNKQIFISRLRAKLFGLPRRDIDERAAFYSEMIDDRIDEGYSEAEAVAAVGDVGRIADEIKASCGFANQREKQAMSVGMLLLLILGSPLWISLIVSAFAVLASLFAAFWSVVISVWAVFVSLSAAAVGCVILCPVSIFMGNAIMALASIGAAAVLAGLAVLSFFGSLEFTRLAAKITVNTVILIKDKIFSVR